ncbi:MAG: ABC transporter permease [Bdellovibrionales bacterium]
MTSYENIKMIKGLNWVGLWTLVKREVGRFLTVYMQTIIAPVVTTLLFYTVFALAFDGIQREIAGIPFMAFLAPGLIIMTMVQNAFANTSSSVVISKVQGNIVDILLPPLSGFELYLGFVIGAVVRGLCVGLATVLVMAVFVPIAINNIWIVLGVGFLGTLAMGSLGLAAGIWSEKFDHIAAVTNFIVTPLTFLSGTFYSVEQLPQMWRVIAHYNPFFFMIDGFRHGFIGIGDSHLAVGFAVLIVINLALMALTLAMLRTGYKIKS